MKKSMSLFGALMFFFAICLASLFFGIFCIKEPEKDNFEDESIQTPPVDENIDADPKEI